MIYVFDTSPFSILFRHYYPRRFPSLWQRFDALMVKDVITSTREVRREIEVSSIETMRDWAKNNSVIFTTPTPHEANFVARIFAVRHFQHNVEIQKRFKGGNNADPFVIAKAYTINATVVTEERLKPNAAKIPNICAHFDVACINFESFMEAENWTF